MSKARILLVEDSKSQANVAMEFLRNNNYDVVYAEDGKKAIKIAKTQPVDLILLDLILPDINGNEICRWLKVDQHTKGIPIIMLTVKDTINDRVTSLESGADDYLSKPYSEVELNARIYASLRTKALQDELKDKNNQLEDLLAKVELLAITDPLTTLFNRRRIETVGGNEFKKSKRYKYPLSFLMADIDKFKEINDNYGHHTGDTVIRGVADIIGKSCRDVDIAARWGGEEFIVICSQTTKEDTRNVASRILKVISEHKFEGIEDRKITISIGIAGLPDDSIDNFEKLVQTADAAMYKAKEHGRNRIEIA
ncbi:response regulator PleD [bacterium BMS3Abin07]|nr:response regulator PleD [bacterium BMS3Abin07]GBE32538.1 response regulator PleD [bacterium BMS3Bbin05]HDL20590.1 diguanylate cyclase [Nitrospirota bacterium]HDO22537.1 diguanylate cyclase [Nitrospirota bacterium]HDZ88451.1 diguanylate cyclase [Nitrospirota bacterium]